MNAARKTELEERLQMPVAPPPPELLEALRREIPTSLHLVAAAPTPPRSTSHGWRIAAGFAVAAFAGWLAYRTGLDRGTTLPRATPAAETPPVSGPASTPPTAIPPTAIPLAAQPAPQPGQRSRTAPSAVVPPAPSSAPAEIRVHVADDKGSSLPGVAVALQGKQVTVHGTTDADGTARFQVPGGKGYELQAELQGFSSVQYPAIDARAGRKTTLDVTLSAAVEDVITVTAESPLLDEKSIRSGNTVSQSELSKIPTAREPWAILQKTPGVLKDRINVGGNEAGQQSGYPPAAGTGPAYFDFDSFEEMQARRGGTTGGNAEPNDAPYGDVFFRSTGTNPFVDADEDPLSTFGLDVDTGSYSVARRYLRDGHLPPPEAIRVEEFVNSFHYGDVAQGDEDFTLRAEGAPTAFADPAHLLGHARTPPLYRLVRFAVTARSITAAQRKPAVLTFVIDVSGSMGMENRLGLVKRALGLLLEQLREDDRVGLVVFGSEARLVLAPTGDHAAIAAAVAGLDTEGSTNAEAGLRLGFDVARAAFRPEAINRLLLCSDGVANVGATGPETILARIGDEAARGIQLSTVGFGMGNYNDALMERLADEGDGTYAYVDDLAEARRIFVENLTGTLQTVAEEAKAQVAWNPKVVSRYRLLGYENRDIADEKFRDDTVDAGEIGAGHTVTALYAVKLARAPHRHDRLATLRIRYRPAGAREFREIARPLLGREVEKKADRASPALRLASTVARFAELLKQTYWGKGDTFDHLAREAAGLEPLAGHEAETLELRDLIERARAAEAARAASEERR